MRTSEVAMCPQSLAQTPLQNLFGVWTLATRTMGRVGSKGLTHTTPNNTVQQNIQVNITGVSRAPVS